MEKPLHKKICLSWFEADWLFYSQKQGWMHMIVFALLFEHHAIPCTPCFPCADPGFFVRGGVWDNLTKKALTTFFFLVLSLFYWSQMVNFEENLFFKVPEGVQLFPRWSNCLYPIETHITWFSRGVRTPWPPSGSALAISIVVVGWYFSVLFKFW